MKKNLILLTALAGVLLITAFDILSDNGKAGYTGSANELLCNDCHNTFGTSNSGSGSITVSSTMTNWQYVPGQTYTVNVKVKHTGRPLFGFGLEALSATNANAGTIQITNTTKTQIKTKSVNGVIRNNVVHQFNGGLQADSAVFSFNWTAPATNIGNVTFYFAGVAANSNGDEFGDYVYNSTKLVTPASMTGLGETSAAAAPLKAWQDRSGTIFLSYTAGEPARPHIYLYDLNGRLLMSRVADQEVNGKAQLQVDRPLGMEEGIYLINVLSGSSIMNTKIHLY
ncbi:MAG: hypothetical protein JNL88_04155 [Bacteroidia bacterium]|nr:hypothetical protein [Bacteroidia bacterium]